MVIERLSYLGVIFEGDISFQNDKISEWGVKALMSQCICKILSFSNCVAQKSILCIVFKFPGTVHCVITLPVVRTDIFVAP